MPLSSVTGPFLPPPLGWHDCRNIPVTLIHLRTNAFIPRTRSSPRRTLARWQPQPATIYGDPLARRANTAFRPGLQKNLLWFALRKLRPANPIQLFQHLADDYGDIAHYKIGWHHIVFLNHPDYIREVLVVQNDNFIKERTVQRTKMLLGKGMITGEGAQHRMQRQVAQPAFHRQRIPEYASVMVREATRMRESWRGGEQRDIAIDMMHLTLNVVAETLFATDLIRAGDEVDELADAINRIMGLYNFLVMLPAAEWLVHVRPPGLAAFVRARKRIDAVVYRMIAAHRRTQVRRRQPARHDAGGFARPERGVGAVAARSGHHHLSGWVRNCGECSFVDVVSALAESGVRTAVSLRD